jgi:hypothetical protein
VYEEQKRDDAKEGRKIEKLETTQETKDDEESTLIFLELRPDRPLCFFTTKYAYAMLQFFHNWLEFHTKPGELPLSISFLPLTTTNRLLSYAPSIQVCSKRTALFRPGALHGNATRLAANLLHTP